MKKKLSNRVNRLSFIDLKNFFADKEECLFVFFLFQKIGNAYVNVILLMWVNVQVYFICH